MLNAPLYNALAKRYGDVDVVNENCQGRYEANPGKVAAGRFKVEKMPRTPARVTDWGEVYHFDCPKCGDHRRRAYVSHLWGQEILEKIGNRSYTVYFTQRLFHCHNEHCDLYPELRKLEINAADKVALAPMRIKAAVAAVCDLPVPTISLLADEVPDKVFVYLAEERKFNPSRLVEKWDVRFCPRGAVYHKGQPDEMEFYEDRILIPIYNRRRLMSWQARCVGDESKLKYITQPGADRSAMIYNMDRVWRHLDVVLVEGITDVWRIGDNAFAGLGTAISQRQIEIMHAFWGHAGRCCICLDEDAWDIALKLENRLREFTPAPGQKPRWVFFNGAHAMRMDNDDPAKHTEADMSTRLQEFFNRMKLEETSQTWSVYPEEDLTGLFDMDELEGIE